MNQMIVRVTDQESLFREASTIVEVGKFKMSWFFLINEETKNVEVMFARKIGYLASIKSITADDSSPKEEVLVLQLKKTKYVVCNDIENDPIMLPWKEEALARDYRSLMTVPIKKFIKSLEFLLYSSEKLLIMKKRT
jgi:hypothetical protein